MNKKKHSVFDELDSEPDEIEASPSEELGTNAIMPVSESAIVQNRNTAIVQKHEDVVESASLHLSKSTNRPTGRSAKSQNDTNVNKPIGKSANLQNDTNANLQRYKRTDVPERVSAKMQIGEGTNVPMRITNTGMQIRPEYLLKLKVLASTRNTKLYLVVDEIFTEYFERHKV